MRCVTRKRLSRFEVQDGQTTALRPYYFRNGYAALAQFAMVAQHRTAPRMDHLMLKGQRSFAELWVKNPRRSRL